MYQNTFCLGFATSYKLRRPNATQTISIIETQIKNTINYNILIHKNKRLNYHSRPKKINKKTGVNHHTLYSSRHTT